jgi:hypothetical protein
MRGRGQHAMQSGDAECDALGRNGNVLQKTMKRQEMGVTGFWGGMRWKMRQKRTKNI